MALSKYPEQMGRFLPFLVEELSGKDIFLMLIIGCLSGTLGLIVLKKKVKK